MLTNDDFIIDGTEDGTENGTEDTLTPPDLPCGHIPPHCHKPPKPSFTVQEEFQETIKRVNKALERCLRMEKAIKDSLDCYMRTISADNVAFKDLITSYYNDFVKTIVTEVNSFESDITNSYNLFESNYDLFKTAVEDRLEKHNEACQQAIEDLNTTLNIHITTVEGRLNSSYEEFTNTINTEISSFKTYVENRIDGQDAVINDAVLYFKTNFSATVASLVADMKESGELNDIIEGEVVPELSRKVNAVAGNTIYVDEIPEMIEEMNSPAWMWSPASINSRITEGCKIVFGDRNYVFSDSIKITVPNVEICSNGGASLSFPNTDGITFPVNSDIHSVKIHDLSIDTWGYGHCINFKGNGSTYPTNIYWCDFYNLTLKATEGQGNVGYSCIYAGDNRGSGGDQLVFSTTFRNIKVEARYGSGFYGLGGLGIRFEGISDANSIKYVFHNCHGVFENCNTTFAGAEYFLYIDDTITADYGTSIIMRNVNMEDVKCGGVCILTDTIAHKNIILEKTGVVVNPETTPLTNHPLRFGLSADVIDLKGVEVKVKGAEWGTVFPMKECLISLGTTPAKAKVLGENVSIHLRNLNFVHTFNEVTFEASKNTSNQFKEFYPTVPEMHIGYMHGARGRIAYDVDCSNMASGSHLINIPEGIHPDGIVLKNLTSGISISGINLNSYNGNDNGKMFYVANTSFNGVMITRENGTYLVITDDGSDLILEPMTVAFFIIYHDNVFGTNKRVLKYLGKVNL